ATGILASVMMAQFILESAFGKSGLSVNANNYFGMKAGSSKDPWEGSTWDGVSKYTTLTEEYYGKTVTITASFRKYNSFYESVADHSAYLLNAKNGTSLRYAGLSGCKDYRQAAQIIKDGGYATGATYVDSICNLIEKWNLTKFDL
ncbi:MAG: glucosaminidase domain-containing protein, partial [Lachnospiraceae bacterium]|nr:glucosaminidase domain-containing protein [Lachnospiraceae bacterium]